MALFKNYTAPSVVILEPLGGSLLRLRSPRHFLGYSDVVGPLSFSMTADDHLGEISACNVEGYESRIFEPVFIVRSSLLNALSRIRVYFTDNTYKLDRHQ